MTTEGAIDSAAVLELVGNAHGNFERVRELIAEHPASVNAAWDWGGGGGDWETPLGAAAHMGRRDIAEFLLEHGARIDLFAAAMLDRVDIVRAILSAYPEMRHAPGPHGIPLVAHAQSGGAEEVLELLTEDQDAA